MLENYLQKFGILSTKEIQEFLEAVSPWNIRKNDFFIREGEISEKIAFVETGIFRSFYSTDRGDEFTYCFTYPGNLLTAYSSYLSGHPTVENIQAVTDTTMLVISIEKLSRIGRKSSNWTMFFKTVAEQQYMQMEKRVFQLQSHDASTRYKDLIENKAEYIEHIPLQYIASYLGITQRHLSRIRKAINY